MVVKLDVELAYFFLSTVENCPVVFFIHNRADEPGASSQLFLYLSFQHQSALNLFSIRYFISCECLIPLEFFSLLENCRSFEFILADIYL